jgi:hypothetical protein
LKSGPSIGNPQSAIRNQELPMAIPTTDAALVDWSTNADTRLTASPATYGTTAAIATAYHAVHQPFVDAYGDVVAARESGTRSSSLCAIKDAAKSALLAFARPLYKQIQANNSGVTAAAKIELGIVVPDVLPSPVPPPAMAPALSVVRVDGRLVRIRLADPAHPTRRRLPAGVNGATVMSFVGATPPADPFACRYEGSTSRSEVDVLFPETVAPGTQVWLVAFFFNARKQNGPACAPVGAVINYGSTMPMAA